MLKIDHILFPTDFTAHAERAFSHAARLAARHGASVCVLNVVPPHQPGENNPMDYLPLVRSTETEQAYLAAQGEGGDARVHYRQVRHAAPAAAILERASELDADLIVMGTRGRQGMSRFLGGSVTEEVVRMASCPTLTVRTGEEEEEGPAPAHAVQRILVPVDFSKPSQLQVAHAAALAEGYGAAVDLLHVIEEAVFPTVYGVDPGTPPAADVEARIREALQQLAQEVVATGQPAEAHVLTGHPAQAILAFANAHESDLVVMTTHGRTGLERFLIGSVAERVVRAAPCPVFTVRPFGKSLVVLEDLEPPFEDE